MASYHIILYSFCFYDQCLGKLCSAVVSDVHMMSSIWMLYSLQGAILSTLLTSFGIFQRGNRDSDYGTGHQV